MKQLVSEQGNVERVQQHTVLQIAHVPVLRIQEQMVENIQVVPRERVSERIEGQIVDVPVPSIEKEIADVMSSSHVAAHAVKRFVWDSPTVSAV